VHLYCGCCDNVLHCITLNSSEHMKYYFCCLFSGCGINAFGMASSNWSLAAESCACAYIAFLAGIFSRYADTTNSCVSSNAEVKIEYTCTASYYDAVLNYSPGPSSKILFRMNILTKFETGCSSYRVVCILKYKKNQLLLNTFIGHKPDAFRPTCGHHQW
jgi:hypothetical protein